MAWLQVEKIRIVTPEGEFAVEEDSDNPGTYRVGYKIATPG